VLPIGHRTLPSPTHGRTQARIPCLYTGARSESEYCALVLNGGRRRARETLPASLFDAVSFILEEGEPTDPAGAVHVSATSRGSDAQESLVSPRRCSLGSGGIAHDFTTSSWSSWAERRLLKPSTAGPSPTDDRHIHGTGERAATSRSAAAFKPQRRHRTQVLDVNESHGTVDVGRLIGENIVLDRAFSSCCPGSGRPGQLEQSSSTSPSTPDRCRGGRIVSRPADVRLEDCRRFRGAPGHSSAACATRYRSPGSGRIFEPSSRRSVQGDGLGSHVTEPSRREAHLAGERVGPASSVSPRGRGPADVAGSGGDGLGCSETILLVEDRPSRMFTMRSQLRYRCSEARGGAAGLELALGAQGRRLLITD